jgi:Holliday junction DNA helicase RuvA
MIGSIKGKISHKAASFIIIDTGSVGYKVFVTPLLMAGLKMGQDLDLVIHTYVREDQITLYGFSTLAELEFFELLLTVSGVGPKSALGIMSLAAVEMIKSAIASGDASVFTKVAGIGRKTAERVIVELREKLKAEGSTTPLAAEHSDALAALVALGYREPEARDALKTVPKETANLQEKIKIALKRLSK